LESIFIRTRKMPLSIKGVTILDDNGDYNVFVNDDLAEAQKKEAFLHEIKHIKRGDFYSEKPASELEASIDDAEIDIVDPCDAEFCDCCVSWIA